MTPQLRAGTIYLKIDGVQYDAKGEFTYNLGRSKRTAIVGADKPHGYKEEPQVGFIEGKVTDSGAMDLNKLVTATDVSCTLELANGKVITVREGYYAADGNVSTGEAEIEFRINGACEEVA